MSEFNYYIYCITYRSDYVPETTGHRNEAIYEVMYKDISAFISKIDCTHVDLSYDNLQCHENVISEIIKNCTLLPMSFSTICKTEEKIKLLLEKYYDQFISNLKYLDGKIELGIKVFYKLNFDEEDKKVKNIYKNPKDYMLRKYELYQNRQKQINNHISKIIKYHKQLSDLSHDSCYTTPIKNNLLFNASYLVFDEKKSDFDKTIGKMKDELTDYMIMYSGPWPAYHFIKIDWQGDENE
ncbi:MAG: hypothetical protein A2Y17_00795 [Clostridiales bacterium GWF2_38_85]|nr:MAG: hypothetical protein A2Y17_00795 [Clostridiales bacterium GWF2_38_85]